MYIVRHLARVHGKSLQVLMRMSLALLSNHAISRQSRRTLCLEMTRCMFIKCCEKVGKEPKVGGSLLTANLSLGRAFAPTLGKTLGLSALVGLTNVGAGQLDKKISVG